MKANSASVPLSTAVASGVAIVIGTLLPWLSVAADSGFISFTGLQMGDDGVVTLIAGALIAMLAGTALSRQPTSRVNGILIVVFGAVSSMITSEWLINFFVDGGYSNPTIGAGSWLTLVGGVLSVAAGAFILVGLSGRSGGASKPWAGIAGITVGVAAAVFVVVAVDALSNQIGGSAFSQISQTLD